jgi:hypothetical protein
MLRSLIRPASTAVWLLLLGCIPAGAEFTADLRGGRTAHWAGPARFCRLEHETVVNLTDARSKEGVVLILFARGGLRPERIALLSDRGYLPALPRTFASVVSRLRPGPGERPWETVAGHVDLQRVGGAELRGSFDVELRPGAPRDFLGPGAAADMPPLRIHGTFAASGAGACTLPEDVAGS